jgi:phage shock protein A
MEYQKSQDSDRDQLKVKIQDLETKYKEVENRRSSLIFEFEKERAKWNLDRDHLVNIKNELQDSVEKLEKKKEFLLRENEKLKNE